MRSRKSNPGIAVAAWQLTSFIFIWSPRNYVVLSASKDSKSLHCWWHRDPLNRKRLQTVLVLHALSIRRSTEGRLHLNTPLSEICDASGISLRSPGPVPEGAIPTTCIERHTVGERSPSQFGLCGLGVSSVPQAYCDMRQVSALAAMAGKKTRRRTGCLTCRARRIKCDEAKPICRRCEAGNLACAGYEQQRSVGLPAARRHRAAATAARPELFASTEDFSDSTSPFPLQPRQPRSRTPGHLAEPHFRHDGLPLVGLPNNPNATQRPCDRARDVLAYHQFLFRTLPVLFPSSHLCFWRDQVCQEAWGTEYLYLTIIALGGMHRAALMLSMSDENDRNRGLDTKVLALQTHALALKELSSSLQEAENRPHILAGALLLMAYFEVSQIWLCKSHEISLIISISVLPEMCLLRWDTFSRLLTTRMPYLLSSCLLVVGTQGSHHMECRASNHFKQP